MVLNDVANIFVGEALESWNAMQAAVGADGDAADARARLVPVMLEIIARKESASDPSDRSAAEALKVLARGSRFAT